jgi:glutamate-1-semialdehyde aminotransferase
VTDRELHIHMARTYLHQAMVVRLQGHHHGWHATLLRWAASRRVRAMHTNEAPAQGDLFA